MSLTSLNPGPLFSATGLNRSSTPPGYRERQSEENGRKKQSTGPIAEVYDAKNTTTKLIILNNQTKSASRLRDNPDREHASQTPDPSRHSSDVAPRPNPDRHLACGDFDSPKFYPDPKMSSGRGSRSARQQSGHTRSRPSSSSSSPYSINQVHLPQPPICGLPKGQRKPPISMKDNTYLTENNLKKGDKLYLWSIARLYDVSKEKEYKQHQYKSLVMKEMFRGFHTEKECLRYLRYLDSPRQTSTNQHQSTSGSPRAKSASPGRRSKDKRSESAKTRNSENSDNRDSQRKEKTNRGRTERSKSRQSRSSNRSKSGKKKKVPTATLR